MEPFLYRGPVKPGRMPESGQDTCRHHVGAFTVTFCLSASVKPNN